MNTQQKVKCARIAETYGRGYQEKQTVSELSELLYTLTRRPAQRKIDWKNDLLDDIADAEIMLEQLRQLYHIELDALRERIDFKLDRQLSIMKTEGKQK